MSTTEPEFTTCDTTEFEAALLDVELNNIDKRDSYFDTTHLSTGLKRRAVRGGAVTLVAQAIKFTLRMGSTAALARLLTPADFGLVAMVTVITGFVEMFKDAGLSIPTIQTKEISHRQVSALFWINVSIGVALMLVIGCSAHLIAWSYGEPKLVGITLVLALTMVFGAGTVQHQAILRRRMEYDRLAVIEIVSMGTGISVAILMAWRGYSYWSLVGLSAGTTVSTAILSFVMSGWIPSLPRKTSGIAPMLSLGVNLTVVTCFNSFAARADNMLIAYFWGPTQLALYDRSYQMMGLPLRQLDTLYSAAIFPALCRTAHDINALRRNTAKVLRASLLITIPITTVLAVFASSIIRLVLGRQWVAAAPTFRLLVIAGGAMAITRVTTYVLLSLGAGKKVLVVDTVNCVLTVTAILSGVRWGANGVATALLVESILWVPVSLLILRQALTLDNNRV